VAGLMARPIVYLDMMSGIQEIHDRTNHSSLVTFQAPLHQYVKESCESITSRSHFGRKQIREYDLR
jgi:hypothetical protein